MTGSYGGFIMNFCKSVPFWNTGILPIVFILAVSPWIRFNHRSKLAGGGGDLATAELWSRVTLSINAFSS